MFKPNEHLDVIFLSDVQERSVSKCAFHFTAHIKKPRAIYHLRENMNKRIVLNPTGVSV